ncbi:MAG: hypothetical protein H6830_04810 [Planctomycetes bacterium]|nr:hypothetical protein [Planctomycetota bacterium]MCB9911247.1 hypothetical protein [Planctomycetota bacterium]
MLRSSLIAAGAVILGGAAVAQQVETDIHAIKGPVKDGGIYHVATGTWTRNVPAGVNLGPDTVYNNTANMNAFTSGAIASVTASFDFVMAGRIPSTSGGAGANRDNYNINGVEIGYCIGDDAPATGPLDVAITIYDTYDACTDPAGYNVAGGFIGTGLPGTDPAILAMGYFTCWTVQFDLTGAEFCLLGDGDGVFDNDLAFDSFGFGMEFDPGGLGGYVGAVTVGPLLCGDRNWTAQAAGEILPGTPGGGGGNTYYGPAETCVPALGGENSSGYDTDDLWWTGDRSSAGAAAGCYWFGGYANTGGCNADGTQVGTNPAANMYALLSADSTTNCVPGGGGGTGVPFCDPADNNSTGFPAVLSGAFGSGVGSDLHLEATQGPNAQFGYFLVGTGVSDPGLALSNGHLCLSVTGGNVFGRYNVPGGALNSVGSFDAGGVLQNLVGTSGVGSGYDVPVTVPITGSPAIVAGATWHFQLWYRDGAAGAGTSNFSNGLSVTF